MKNTIIIGLLLLSLRVSAQVIVYSQIFTTTTTGAGSMSIQKFNGYVVFDMSGNLIAIDANTKTKVFTTDDVSALPWQFYYPVSSRGQTFVLAVPVNGADLGTAFARGAASSQNVGTGTFSLAKTMKLEGTAVGKINQSDTIVDYKGSLVFDSTHTVAANLAGSSVGQTITNLEAVLVSKGYANGD